MLATKSITELRGIAQACGVKDVFSKDIPALVHAIELKQQEAIPAQAPVLPLMPAYDARLMTKPPSKRCTQEEVETALEQQKALGLTTHYEDETWRFTSGKKTDTGTLRQPLRQIIRCANQVLA